MGLNRLSHVAVWHACCSPFTAEFGTATVGRPCAYVASPHRAPSLYDASRSAGEADGAIRVRLVHVASATPPLSLYGLRQWRLVHRLAKVMIYGPTRLIALTLGA